MIVKVCFGRRDEFWAIGSQLVMAVEQTKASHAWIEIDGNVYESVYPKSRRIAKVDHPYTIEREFYLYIDDSKKSDVLRFVYSMMDRKYSFKQLAIIAFGNLNSWINKKISKENYNGKHKLICTELCARFLVEFFKADFGESMDTVGINDLMFECRFIEIAQGGYK